MSGLRAALEAAKNAIRGSTMDDFTILEEDPYRFDTPAWHRDAAWFAGLIGTREIHCRGSHYIAIGTRKPNGEKYANNEDNWIWIQQAATAARWLRYVDFDQITDERNSPPVFCEFSWPVPEPGLALGEVELLLPDHLTPLASLDDFRGVQQDHLAIYGEKTSLRSVLSPIAEEYQADLLLPTGNSSNTMIHRLAKQADDDGRRLVVFYFSDADPSGWNMAVEVARKLQAFKTGWFPDLDFELTPVALSPEQVVTYGLPSEPFKVDPKTGLPKDRRVPMWKAAFGVDQTEIDALATLQPDVLKEIAREAIEPFFDRTLAARVERAHAEWLEAAQAAVVETLGAERLERMEAEARSRLAQLQRDASATNDAMYVEDDLAWPAVPELPDADPPVNLGGACLPMISSEEDWTAQTLKLKAYKAYREVDRCTNCGELRPPSKAKKSEFCGVACSKAYYADDDSMFGGAFG
jgi:hypothetical protein